MTLLNDPLVISILAGLAAFLVPVGLLLMALPILDREIDRFIERYDKTFGLELEFSAITRGHVWAVIGGALLLLALSLAFLPYYTTVVLALVLAGGIAYLPRVAYRIARRRRRLAVDDALPGLLQQLAANLKNEKNIGQVLSHVTETAPPPMDYELRLLAQKERDLGSFPAALDDARERIGSDWFDVTAAILKTTSERASTEAEALQNLSRVFAQLRSMRDRIDTATRQGRTSMQIILAAPFIMAPAGYFFLPARTWEDIDFWWVKVFLAAAFIMAIIGISLAVWFKSEDV